MGGAQGVRFLNEDMFAGAEAVDGHRCAHFGIGGEVNGVDVRIGEQVAVVAVGSGHGRGRGRFVAPSIVYVGDGDARRAGYGIGRFDRSLSSPTATDNADAQGLAMS